MPVFRSTDGKVVQLQLAPFSNERELQEFVQQNIEVLLDARLVATEFATGEKHGGRIDTLALDEEGSPVIVEYKWERSESIINQGLFYLDWLLDHRGDFELAVLKRLGTVQISWHAPRLVLVASGYTKYDSYAVNRLSDKIELLRYQRYSDGTFLLETVNEPLSPRGKNAPKPTAPKHDQASQPDQEQSTEYTLDYHEAKTNPTTWNAFLDLRERLLALTGVEERVNQRSQITYRTTKSFAACDFRKKSVMCQFKGPEKIDDPESRAKDIRSYQWGYPWAVDLTGPDDVGYVYELLKAAYDREQ